MVKMFREYAQRSRKYLSKHPDFNAIIHMLGGVGIGFLLTYPVAGAHPVRYGAVFLILAVIGHWWAGRKMKQ